MTLGDPIQLRLKIDKQLFYQDEAARLGRALSVYLRERLDASDETHEAIASLRCEMASLRVMLEDLVLPKSTPVNNDPTAASHGSEERARLVVLGRLRPDVFP